MAKKVEKAPEAPANPLAPVTVTAAPPAKVYVLRVKPGAKFSGARLAWYTRLLEYQGKTLAEFTASCVANPPSTPEKGKLAGMLEPVSGWVSAFKGKKCGAVLVLEEA